MCIYSRGMLEKEKRKLNKLISTAIINGTELNDRKILKQSKRVDTLLYKLQNKS